MTQASVLVVDDAPENLTLMHDLLKDLYRVQAATSGETALRIATSSTPPDLILLDIMMPGMDGYEVCRRLRADPRTAGIPVIFLTARTEEADERMGLEIGAVDYIMKPVSGPIVLARVRNHLALKGLTDAMREKNVELDFARVVAEQASHAKSDFLSRMSHELRSPLNAIIGFAQLMESERPAPTASQQSSLTQILHGGWYLLELINEILDLAVIESGRLTPAMEAVNLGELLQECQDLVAELARKRAVTLYMPTVGAPVLVQADRTRLKQVLINLLTNAIKYNREGGRVTVDRVAHGENRVRLTVTDTGLGLEQAQVAQLFESFNRLGRESSGEQGTGIGLVVSKRLVELMNGSIGVESTPGVGSAFWIELAAEETSDVGHAGSVSGGRGDAAAAEMAPTELPDARAAARPARRRTVLYVEDNPANLRLVEQLILRRSDLRMLSAGDASYGIQIARTAHPDVILMDINLPGMNGFGALRALRTDPATRDIPVIALSVNAYAHDIEKGKQAGFFRYLTKPIHVTEFMATLDEALAHGALAAPSYR